jgi:hypothetical protein
MSNYNTGIKKVLTLRKYVNGQATSETKLNLPSDPDYIPDYADLLACPVDQPQQTTTTTTSTTTTTTTSAPATTTTTTLPQNFTNVAIQTTFYTQTGTTIIEGDYQYYVYYPEVEFYVPQGFGPFDLSLSASFTTGPSGYSARARVVKSDGSSSILMGNASTTVEASPHVIVDTNTPNANVKKSSQALSAGYWKAQIYDIQGPNQGTFGRAVFTITETP